MSGMKAYKKPSDAMKATDTVPAGTRYQRSENICLKRHGIMISVEGEPSDRTNLNRETIKKNGFVRK